MVVLFLFLESSSMKICEYPCYTITKDFFFQERDVTILNRGHRKKRKDKTFEETMQDMPTTLSLK